MRVGIVFCLFSVIMTFSWVGANAEEYYLVARKADDKFLGSRLIHDQKFEENVRVYYCGRAFWVDVSSIAWTHFEAKRGRMLTLELLSKNGRVRICSHPERQVNLADLGIIADNDTVVLSGVTTAMRRTRFQSIANSYKVR